MARIHTHYDNLKVARDAPPEVIRAAYKTLSQKHHPDRNGNSAQAIRVIQLINAAYEVLSDPVKRREHDEWIARTEALPDSEALKTPQDYSNTHVHHHHSSRRSRRHRRYPLYDLRHPASAAVAHALHKLRLLVDHFSRKLFRRT
jgi:curved DNA-binding protein CbpA